MGVWWALRERENRLLHSSILFCFGTGGVAVCDVKLDGELPDGWLIDRCVVRSMYMYEIVQ